MGGLYSSLQGNGPASPSAGSESELLVQGSPEKSRGLADICNCRCCCGSCLVVTVLLLIPVLWCASQPVSVNVTPDFIQTELNGDHIFDFRSMPEQQRTSVLKDLTSQLGNRTHLDEKLQQACPTSRKREDCRVANLAFGFASAEAAVRMMYDATKVAGVFERVPEKLRGVFWMKGNGVPEELTVLQYGQWFEAERTLLVPFAPFMWAWPGGKPEKAPFDGAMYEEDVAFASALILVNGGHGGFGLSFKFQPCPSGLACAAGSSDLTYATLDVNGDGDLRTHVFNGANFLSPALKSLTGAFDLQEMPLPDGTSSNGALWRRGIKWGIGTCHCFEFGSYQLTKVMDADGQPLEPYYSEFLDYMGDVPLFVWTGYKNESLARRHYRQYRSEAGAVSA